MTTKTKPRSPSEVAVSSATEWTDFHGVLELFGLRRSTAYHLYDEGLIKSVSLAEHGENGVSVCFTYLASAHTSIQNWRTGNRLLPGKARNISHAARNIIRNSSRKKGNKRNTIRRSARYDQKKRVHSG